MKSFFSSSVPESLLSVEALSEDEAEEPVSLFSAGLLPQAVSEAASSAVHASSMMFFSLINAFFPEETRCFCLFVRLRRSAFAKVPVFGKIFSGSLYA